MTDYENDDSNHKGGWKGKMASWQAKGETRATVIESRFLGLLRYSMLILAAIVLIGAISLFSLGAVKQVGSSEVEPEQVQLTAADLSPQTPQEARASGEEVVEKKPFAVSDRLKAQTLGVYRKNFASFERGESGPSNEQIIETVWPEERREAFEKLDLSRLPTSDGQPHASGEALAHHAVSLVGESSKEAGFKRSLNAYKNAKEVEVCRDVTRERSRTVEYWDDYSTSCSNWYYSPVGCMATRTVSEPYTVKSCEMQLPTNLETPAQAMSNGVERFLTTANIRITNANYEAETRSAEINARKVAGRADIANSGKWFAGFLALMLLYLLVALERHHRVLRHILPSNGSPGSGSNV